MYKRYYDGYNAYSRNKTSYSGGEVVIPKESEEETHTSEIQADSTPLSVSEKDIQFTVQNEDAAVASISNCSSNSFNGLSKIFDGISIDDIILLGVILIVLKDSSDDPLLIIILAVVFISGLIDKD